MLFAGDVGEGASHAGGLVAGVVEVVGGDELVVNGGTIPLDVGLVVGVGDALVVFVGQINGPDAVVVGDCAKAGDTRTAAKTVKAINKVRRRSLVEVADTPPRSPSRLKYVLARGSGAQRRARRLYHFHSTGGKEDLFGRPNRILLVPGPRDAALPDDRTGLEANSDLRLLHRLYNASLQERQYAQQHGARLTLLDQQCQLPGIKRTLPEYATVYSMRLQHCLRRVDNAFARNRRGVTGRPRFRKLGKYVSMTYPAIRKGYKWDARHFHFSKVGKIRYRFKGRPRWFGVAIPKGCTIKRIGARWFAYLRFQIPDVPPPAPQPGAIGIDVGIEHMVATSDGDFHDSPRAYSKIESKIRRAQRVCDRRQKNSKNREKANARVSRLYERARNRRLDNHHKLSRKLADQYGMIAVESKLTGLSRGWLAKHVYDVGWGRFMRLLEYKLIERGGRIVRVHHQWTSQRCSGCGHVKRKALKERIHACVPCGLVLQRDHNAARNILAAATSKIPAERGESTPVEIGSHRVSDSVPVKEAGNSVK